MMWKKLGVSVAVMLGVSLGSAASYAMAEDGAEGLENLPKEQVQKDSGSGLAVTTNQEDVFDPAEVEDKVFVSAKGHQVKFWRDGKDQWRADVIEDFTNIEHEGLPVKFGDDWSVKRLAQQETSKHQLHILLRSDLPEDFDEEGLVYVGSRGLKGGCCRREYIKIEDLGIEFTKRRMKIIHTTKFCGIETSRKEEIREVSLEGWDLVFRVIEMGRYNATTFILDTAKPIGEFLKVIGGLTRNFGGSDDPREELLK